MVMTLYADVLLAVNFVMNSLILWVVSKCIRKRVKPLRLLAGGLSAALLHGILLFTVSEHIHPLIASVFILSAGVAVSFCPARPRLFFTCMVTAYLSSFAIGGLGMGLFYLTDFPYALHILSTDMAGLRQSLPWFIPVICVLSVYLLIKLGMHIVERHTIKKQALCPVQVFLGDAAVCFDALIDTGHNLKEPISQSPVIVAEFDRVKKLLPDGLKVMFFENQEIHLQSLIHKQTEFHTRLRMIPFTSLGRTHGMLVGFKPDKVHIGEHNPINAVIGIYNNRLTRDGRYQGLVSPELMETM
jgi:stage II sporulation protein GA (sporulation sigma-E factor processing peptidase)